KAELFSPDRAARGVILLGTEWAEQLQREARIPVTTIAMEAQDDAAAADWRVQLLEELPTRTAFRISSAEHGALVTSIQAIGQHSAADAALALVMVLES